MARIGLSKPYIATYVNNNGTVTYSARTVLGKYTNIDIAWTARTKTSSTRTTALPKPTASSAAGPSPSPRMT